MSVTLEWWTPCLDLSISGPSVCPPLNMLLTSRTCYLYLTKFTLNKTLDLLGAFIGNSTFLAK